MRSPSTSAMLWGAGLVLISGCVWAARIWDEQPRATGPDLRSLEQLAARVHHAPEEAPALDVPGPRHQMSPPAPPRPVPAVRPAPVPHLVLVRMERRPEARRPAPAAAPVLPAVVVNDDAVKNLALLGVTFAGGKDAAWLMDLNSRAREMAAVGESVFGFTVKEIEPDRVLLTRGGRDYSLRLGEKPIVVASASPVTVASAAGAGEEDSPFVFGPGGPGGPGGRAFGPGGFVGGPGGFNGFGPRFPGSFGGNNFGGGGFSGGGSGPGGTSSGGSSGGGGANGGGGFAPQISFGGGGFGPTSGGTGGAGGSSSSSSASGTTSNPQTARRQGSRLTGDADPVEKPEAIVNPQTQRRTGSSNQPAFGEADGTVRGQTGSGRSGSGGTGSR